MKSFYIAVFCSFCCFSSKAQPDKFKGIWEGELNAGGQQLRMIFTFKKNANAVYMATIQAPQQSPIHIPADTIIFTSANEISLSKKQFNMSFTGKLVNDSTIVGTFIQGISIPLQLKKVEKPATVIKKARPQTPKPPFNYQSMDISFNNYKANIKLSGTLTVPDKSQGKKYPVLVLISGSGPQDRDETILEHKPFAVLADHLTKKGFAVFRYDDRGTAKSGGNHAGATTADFADDTRAAVDFLKTVSFIDSKKIGLIGHSEGGMIAPMVAASSKDIQRIVLLAGPGIPGAELLAIQNAAIYESAGVSKSLATRFGAAFFDMVQIVIRSRDSLQAYNNLVRKMNEWSPADSVRQLLRLNGDAEMQAYATAFVQQIYSPWFRYFLSYDPVPTLKKLSCDVLALNGSKDIQVISSFNLEGIKKALQKSKAKRYEIKEISQLNHLFQTCKRCTLDEYGDIEETFSPLALEIISDWLLKHN